MAIPVSNESPVSAMISFLNRSCWLASIGLWLWIVIRSEIWTIDVTSRGFWINLMLFLVAGLGTVATTHFTASAPPLLLGLMAATAHDVKAGWAWLNMYVIAAAAIGFFSAIVRLSAYLNNPPPGRADREY
jgi:hypothetical protein